MSSHDLEIRDSQKVISKLDELEDNLKFMEAALDTLGEVADMDLAVGAVNHALRGMGSLKDELLPCHKIVSDIHDHIQQQQIMFDRNNENMSF